MGAIAETITEQVLGLDGVTAGPHRFGGTEFRYGRFELGHIHGDRQADVLFSRAQRAELVAAGATGPHHIYPESGWTTLYLRDPADVPRAVELFRLAHARRAATGTAGVTGRSGGA